MKEVRLMSKLSHTNMFLSKKNFLLAFKRLQTAGRSLYKDLYIPDLKIFGQFLDSNINTLITSIDEGTYEFNESIKYYLPKPSGTVIPITLPSFTDLLIYQAIVNVIASVTVNNLGKLYNRVVYGNILNEIDTKDSIFFYKPWKKQWKRYSELHMEYYQDGYVYVSEFDISSFFDTVNHKVLENMLREYGVQKKLIKFLVDLLSHITKDSYRHNFFSSTGIPQGPIASFYLADLYLHYIDMKFLKKTIGNDSKIKYIRYVDDIKIYSKNKYDRDINLAQLDLFARDIGLIPQSNKIKRRKMDNPDYEIRQQFKSFSSWAYEYKKEGELSRKNHNKLKTRFMRTIRNSDGNFILDNYGKLVYDKTTLSFSMYKLRKDDEIKEILLKYFYSFTANIESILYYLNRYYSKDKEIVELLNKHLKSKNTIVRHIDAMIFKYFKKLPFDEKIYTDQSDNSYWLVQYYLVEWLENNKKIELLKNHKSKYPIVNRKVEYYRSKYLTNNIIRKQQISDLIESDSIIDALSATSFYGDDFNRNYIMSKKRTKGKTHNEFINGIIDETKPDILNKYFGKRLGIKTNKLFNLEIFDEQEYTEMKKNWLSVKNNMNTNPSLALMNINNFNHVLTNQLCKYFGEDFIQKEYANTLKSLKWGRELLLYVPTLYEINNVRNQETDSHPYNKEGEIRKKVTFEEFDIYFEKELKAIEELIIYFNNTILGKDN
jgi:hypothetical protein